MSKLAKWMWGSLLAVLLAPAGVFAQSPVAAQERPLYGQRELDMMLAPVALYPDPLLSQVLMAATYPLEVVQAARWSRSYPDLHGDEAVRAVANFDWDPSVKSLVAFPEVLQQMNEKLDWTETLGDAFLAQEDQVMQTVQQLRGRANAAGNLRSTDELVVERRGDDFILEPPSPEEIYVPYYDSRVIYGSWWWPGYEPVYWNPWPGYSYYPGYAGFGWGLGIPVGAGFFYGAFDWPRRYVRFGSHRPFYFHGDTRWSPSLRWHHDPGHRRGVLYRNAGSSQYPGRGDRDGRREYQRSDRPRVERRGDAGAPPRALQSSPGFFAPRTGETRVARPAGATPIPAAPRYRAERAQGGVRSGNMERPQRPEQAAPRQSPRPAPAARPASPAQSGSVPRQQSAPAPSAAAQPSVRSAPRATSPSAGGERNGITPRDR